MTVALNGENNPDVKLSPWQSSRTCHDLSIGKGCMNTRRNCQQHYFR